MVLGAGNLSALASLIACATCIQLVAGEAFLGHGGKGDTDADLQSAMATVMGCGASPGATPREHVDAIKRTLAPMWKALPKNRWGKVEWRMMRYASHRFFMQQFSLLVKGLEPSRAVNDTAVGSAHILSAGGGGSVVDALLRGKVAGQGFSLDDMAFMIATLEQVIHDGESARLERAYTYMGFKHGDVLSHEPLVSTIEMYMMLWLFGDDSSRMDRLLQNPELKYRALPQWGHLREFAAGMVAKVEFEASSTPGAGFGRAALQRSYSFEDAHKAVSHMTKTFASFWETECQSIKNSLSALDRRGSGRIGLSQFYGANADGEWRFGESEAYLRELGALDETSVARGKQVIIPNYLQGASNCIVTTPYYMVCCINECEQVLNEIEAAVGAPTASTAEILELVQQMSDFDDEPPRFDAKLKTQLLRIAEVNAGRVPLHGRLFAQWMHYVLPRECSYPHKSGVANMVSIQDFGSASFASREDVREHSAKRNVTAAAMADVEAAQWMSQWSEDEELGLDLGVAPWDRAGSWIGLGCGATAMLGVAWTLASVAVKELKGAGTHSSSANSFHKTHFV